MSTAIQWSGKAEHNMHNRFHLLSSVCFLMLVAFAPSAPAQMKFDLAKDIAVLNQPGGAWLLGWMAPEDNLFHHYSTASDPHGLGLVEWREPASGNNPSGGANVIYNSTNVPASVSDTTWSPRQVAFRPGECGQRSVIRWSSPLAGTIRLTAAFEGRSGFVTSGVEIYHNSARLFSGAVTGFGAASQITFTTNLSVHPYDMIDFRVNDGNGNWVSDTTQIRATLAQTGPDYLLGQHQLEEFVSYLKTRKQEETLDRFQAFLHSWLASQQTTDVAVTLAVLQNLRDGHTNAAMERLERRLSSDIVGFTDSYNNLPASLREKVNFGVLRNAREYRAKFPVKPGKSSLDDGASFAFERLGEMLGEKTTK